MDSIRVFVPATVANVTCAFDILGFSLANPGDEIAVKKTNSKKIVISKITGDEGKLSHIPEKNTVAVSIQSCLKSLNIKNVGLDIELHKKMPIGSGLGSSAASSVAGVFAINHLLSLGLTNDEILPYAIQGEFLASGAIHADNVAPALYGGLILIPSYEPLNIVKLPYPPNLFSIVIFPKMEINTKDARKILPSKITLTQAIKQWGNIAGLVTGFSQKNISLIKRSMKDEIIEPHRASLIPGYHQAKQIAIDIGAIGFGISGSGPSLFALSEDRIKAEKIASAIALIFDKKNISTNKYISKFGEGRPIILDKN